MWRLPLFAGYRRMLDSKVADINNAPSVPFGGAITAALYLKEFVPDDVPWAHFDMMAWNNMSRPGRPEGGEAQAARAIFTAIEKRIAKRPDDSHLIAEERAKRDVSGWAAVVMYPILRDARLRHAPREGVARAFGS